MLFDIINPESFSSNFRGSIQVLALRPKSNERTKVGFISVCPWPVHLSYIYSADLARTYWSISHSPSGHADGRGLSVYEPLRHRNSHHHGAWLQSLSRCILSHGQYVQMKVYKILFALWFA